MEHKVTQQGGLTVVEVWRPDRGEGLFKAELCAASGRMPLGTLLPEGGRLYLRRALRTEELKGRGLWPVLGVETYLAYPFHGKGDAVEWTDELLRRCARCLPPHTVSRSGGAVTFSFPFDPCAPFPFLPAFCFARVENGRLLFCFDQQGIPLNKT